MLTSSCTAVSRVFAVPKQQVTRAKLANVAKHSARPVVGILPTGWAATGAGGVTPGASGGGGGGGGGEEGKPPSAGRVDDAPHILAVPYSLHAPHAELEALVAALRPTAVAGFISLFLFTFKGPFFQNS